MKVTQKSSTVTLAFLILMILIPLSTFAEGKRKFAIMDLRNGNGVTSGEAQIITDRLRIEIFNTGEAAIMERNQMNEIMKEQGFQMSGLCSDDGCMVEVGQVLGVERLVGGSIGKLGSMYLLNFRVIDVSTAQITSVVSLDIKGSIEEVVYKLSAIASQLTSENSGSQTVLTVNSKAEVKHTVTKNPSGIEQDTPTPSKTLDFDCSNELILFRTMDYGNILPFKVTPETRAEVDKDLRESVEEFLTDEVDKDLELVVVTEEQIAALPTDCNSKVIRAVLTAYSVEDGEGTATAEFYFFKDPRTHKYGLKVSVTDKGGSYSNEQERIQDTFEELEDKLAEKLDDFDDEVQMMDPDR